MSEARAARAATALAVSLNIQAGEPEVPAVRAPPVARLALAMNSFWSPALLPAIVADSVASAVPARQRRTAAVALDRVMAALAALVVFSKPPPPHLPPSSTRLSLRTSVVLAEQAGRTQDRPAVSARQIFKVILVRSVTI